MKIQSYLPFVSTLLIIWLAGCSVDAAPATPQTQPNAATATGNTQSITFSCAFQPDYPSFKRLKKSHYHLE